MIPKDQETKARGKRLLESFSDKQVELLHEVESVVEPSGRTIHCEDLEDYELALIAKTVDLFDMNDNDDVLHPGHGMPLIDLRTAYPPNSLPDPPDNAGRCDLIEQELRS